MMYSMLQWRFWVATGSCTGDVKFSVNDTTNSAVATSRQVSHGEEGTCMMHVINLVAEHAVGKKARNHNKVVVGSFPELEKLRKKGRGAIGYIYFQRRSRSEMNCTSSETAITGSLSFDVLLTTTCG